MKKVYIDESGFTGYDLLNIQQPFQAASAIKISEKEAEKIIKNYFPRVKGELKHKTLSKRRSQWKYLLDLQKELLENYEAFTYVCDKKYFLILLFLNNCVEPFYYENGVDFYENGQNYALASLLYYKGSLIWGEKSFENLLYYYQRATHSGLDLNISMLTDHAKTILGKELSEVLIPLVNQHDGVINEIKKKDLNTDLTYIIVLSLITHIEKFLNEPYIIIHDKSKQLSLYSEYFKKLIGIKEKKKFQKTQITSVSFPIKLYAVDQLDSKASFGIQLADILSGGIIEKIKSMKDPSLKNDYNQKVLWLYKDKNLIHMLPCFDFDQNAEFRADNNAQEFISFISRHFA